MVSVKTLKSIILDSKKDILEVLSQLNSERPNKNVILNCLESAEKSIKSSQLLLGPYKEVNSETKKEEQKPQSKPKDIEL